MAGIENWLINRAAMGRRGSCFTRGFFLTARPWAERGSCFTRGFFFFGSFVGDQTQTSLGHTSNDATYGVSSCKEYIENLWG